MKITLLRKKIFPLILICGIGYAGIASVLYSSNPPSSMTNAPGESNCTSCHSGSLNPTPANLTNLTLSGTFTGNGYLPDSTYSITLSYSQSGINKFGFQITTLRTDNDAPAGTLTAGTGSVKSTASVSGATRDYLSHNSGGTSGSGSKSWTFTWKAPSSNVDTITFYAIVNATNGDNTNSGDQVYAKEFKIASSTLLPTASIQTSRSLVCAGDTMTLSASGTNNPTSYRWKFHQGFPQIVNTQTVIRTYSTPGTFSDTLWVINNKGESKPVRAITEVVAKPSASIPGISPGTEVCVGDSISLTANSGAGLHYVWNTGNPADTFQTLVARQPGSYEVTVTNANGCSRSSTPLNLNFKARPVSSLTSNTSADTLCLNDTLFITADTGFINYDFYNGSTVVQSGTSNTLKLSAIGTYSIRVVSNNGLCTASSITTITKTIKPRLAAPALSCGTATTDEVNFIWNPVSGAAGYEVSVDQGAFQSVSGTSFLVNGLNFNTQVNLRVRAIQNGNCPEGLLSSFNCKSLPCSQFTYDLVLSDSLVCEGDTVSLDVNNISLTNYTVSFDGNPASTQTHFEFVPMAANPIFTIDIIDLNSPGCPPYTITGSITVDIKFPVFVNFSDTGVCIGEPVDISTSSGFSAYALLVNGIPIQTNTSGIFSISNPVNGDKVRILGQGTACQSLSPEQIITVYTPRKPGFIFTGTNRIWNFVDTTTQIASRIWNFGDNTSTATAAAVIHTYLSNNTFNVKLYTTDLNGCIDSTIQQVTTDNVGVMEAFIAQVKLYPNPAHDYLHVESGVEVNQAEIWNTIGQRLKIKTINSDQFDLDLSGLPPGAYFLKLKWNDQETAIRFMIN